MKTIHKIERIERISENREWLMGQYKPNRLGATSTGGGAGRVGPNSRVESNSWEEGGDATCKM